MGHIISTHDPRNHTHSTEQVTTLRPPAPSHAHPPPVKTPNGNAATCASLTPGGGLFFNCRKCDQVGGGRGLCMPHQVCVAAGVLPPPTMQTGQRLDQLHTAWPTIAYQIILYHIQNGYRPFEGTKSVAFRIKPRADASNATSAGNGTQVGSRARWAGHAPAGREQAEARTVRRGNKAPCATSARPPLCRRPLRPFLTPWSHTVDHAVPHLRSCPSRSSSAASTTTTAERSRACPTSRPRPPRPAAGRATTSLVRSFLATTSAR